MNKKEKELIGALIGLAKACNVHLKTENTDGIIIKSLASIFPLEENGEELLQRVREEKLAVAPDCANLSRALTFYSSGFSNKSSMLHPSTLESL